jgi:hypothetical protein
MTSFARTDGKRVTKITRDLGTSEVILAAAKQKMPVTLESITFCNTTGTNERKFNFYIKSGGTNYYVFRAKPLAQWQTQSIDTLSLVLTDGQSFCVSAESAASGVDVTCTFIESTPMQDAGTAGNSLNNLRGAQA